VAMKVESLSITASDLAEDYLDDGENGVTGYAGRLDIRPPYQREFVYKDDQRNAVIDTATRGLPLNVMYWAKRSNGSYEVIDGQQRTISLCQYINGDFSHSWQGSGPPLYFDGLPSDQRERLLAYKLTVYVCEGTDSEKLAWFKTINIAGEPLTDQELLNAVYAGTWLSSAKRSFSQTNCRAAQMAGKYVKGVPIRQELLRMAIKWALDEGETLEGYMARHQFEPNADALWTDFRAVIDWVKAIFPNQISALKSVDWHALYHKHRHDVVDVAAIEKRCAELFADGEVTNPKGVYAYVLDGDERHLNIRAFNQRQRIRAYERQGGKCAITGEALPIEKMEADHIIPWSKGGKTDDDNCQMVSMVANRRKGNR